MQRFDKMIKFLFQRDKWNKFGRFANDKDSDKKWDNKGRDKKDFGKKKKETFKGYFSKDRKSR
jgi:hypothetical protein